MTAPLPTDVLQDEIAISLAKALAAANKHACQLGVEADKSHLSISEHSQNGTVFWRINYGPKNYVGRRGGDLIIDVNPTDGRIHQVLFGQ